MRARLFRLIAAVLLNCGAPEACTSSASERCVFCSGDPLVISRRSVCREKARQSETFSADPFSHEAVPTFRSSLVYGWLWSSNRGAEESHRAGEGVAEPARHIFARTL